LPCSNKLAKINSLLDIIQLAITSLNDMGCSMSNGNHSVAILNKHIEKSGVAGLLPQNLPEELLLRMNLEADAIDKNESSSVPASTLLVAILNLANGTDAVKGDIKIKISEKQLSEYFEMYVIQLRLEFLRRKSEIQISEKSLPTLENIFDKNKSFEIVGLV
jgi:hypothetical protein